MKPWSRRKKLIVLLLAVVIFASVITAIVSATRPAESVAAMTAVADKGDIVETVMTSGTLKPIRRLMWVHRLLVR